MCCSVQIDRNSYMFRQQQGSLDSFGCSYLYRYHPKLGITCDIEPPKPLKGKDPHSGSLKDHLGSSQGLLLPYESKVAPRLDSTRLADEDERVLKPGSETMVLLSNKYTAVERFIHGGPGRAWHGHHAWPPVPPVRDLKSSEHFSLHFHGTCSSEYRPISLSPLPFGITSRRKTGSRSDAQVLSI